MVPRNNGVSIFLRWNEFCRGALPSLSPLTTPMTILIILFCFLVDAMSVRIASAAIIIIVKGAG